MTYVAWFAAGILSAALFGLTKNLWVLWQIRQREKSWDSYMQNRAWNSQRLESLNRRGGNSPPPGPPSITEDRVQRGQGNGGPSTEKPAIVAKPQFPSPRNIREDFLP